MSRSRPASVKRPSSRAKVRAHRARLRRQGLRPVQIWVPDVRAPRFKAEAAKQARRVARAKGERGTMDFIEQVEDFGGAR